MSESGPAAAPAGALLGLVGLSRAFGGIRALDDVSFQVAPGQVFGLIGPNGAGKTTLLNLLSGFLHPNRGTIDFAGVRIENAPPQRIARLGLRRTFQNVRVFPTETALANVLIGEHVRRRHGLLPRLWGSPAERAEESQLRRQAIQLLERVGLGGREQTRAADLAYGDRRRLEIARALAGEPRLLLLDEPVAGVGGEEVAEIAGLLRDLAREGQTILLIEHNVSFVMGLCDRIAVLDFGRKIAEGTPAEILANPAVVEAYLGVAE